MAGQKRRLTPDEIEALTGFRPRGAEVAPTTKVAEAEEDDNIRKPREWSKTATTAATITRLLGAVGSGVVGMVPAGVTTTGAAAIGGAAEALAQKIESPDPIDKSTVAAESVLSAIPLGKVYKYGAPLAKNMLRGAGLMEAGNLLRRWNQTGNVLPQSPLEAGFDIGTSAVGALGGLIPAREGGSLSQRLADKYRFTKPDPAEALAGLTAAEAAGPRLTKPVGDVASQAVGGPPPTEAVIRPGGKATPSGLRVKGRTVERPEPVHPSRSFDEEGSIAPGVEAERAKILREAKLREEQMKNLGPAMDVPSVQESLNAAQETADRLAEAQRKANKAARKQEQQLLRREQAADLQDIRARKGATDVGKVKAAEAKAQNEVLKEAGHKSKAEREGLGMLEAEQKERAAQDLIDDLRAREDYEALPEVVTETSVKVPTRTGSQQAKQVTVKKRPPAEGEGGDEVTPRAPKAPPARVADLTDPDAIAMTVFPDERSALIALGKSGKRGTVIPLAKKGKWGVQFEDMAKKGPEPPEAPPAAPPKAPEGPQGPAAPKGEAKAPEISKPPVEAAKVPEVPAVAPEPAAVKTFDTWIKAQQHAKQTGGKVVKTKDGKFKVNPPDDVPPTGGAPEGGTPPPAPVKPTPKPKAPKGGAGAKAAVPVESEADKQLAARAGVKSASEVQPHKAGLSEKYIETGEGPVGKAPATPTTKPPAKKSDISVAVKAGQNVAGRTVPEGHEIVRIKTGKTDFVWGVRNSEGKILIQSKDKVQIWNKLDEISASKPKPTPEAARKSPADMKKREIDAVTRDDVKSWTPEELKAATAKYPHDKRLATIVNDELKNRQAVASVAPKQVVRERTAKPAAAKTPEAVKPAATTEELAAKHPVGSTVNAYGSEGKVLTHGPYGVRVRFTSGRMAKEQGQKGYFDVDPNHIDSTTVPAKPAPKAAAPIAAKAKPAESVTATYKLGDTVDYKGKTAVVSDANDPNRIKIKVEGEDAERWVKPEIITAKAAAKVEPPAPKVTAPKATAQETPAPKAAEPKAKTPEPFNPVEVIRKLEDSELQRIVSGKRFTLDSAHSVDDEMKALAKEELKRRKTIAEQIAKGNVSRVRVDLAGAKNAADVQRRVVGELEKYAAKVKEAEEMAGVDAKGVRTVPEVPPMTLEVPGGPTITVNRDQVNNLIERFSKGMPSVSGDKATAHRTMSGMKGGPEVWKGIVDKAPKGTSDIPKEANWGTAQKPTLAKAGEAEKLGVKPDITEHAEIVGPSAATKQFDVGNATAVRGVSSVDEIPADMKYAIFSKDANGKGRLLVAEKEHTLKRVAEEWKEEGLEVRSGVLPEGKTWKDSFAIMAENQKLKPEDIQIGVVGADKTPIAPIVQKAATKPVEGPTVPVKVKGQSPKKSKPVAPPEAPKEAPARALPEAMKAEQEAATNYGNVKDAVAAGKATREELRAAGEALGRVRAEIAKKAAEMLEANPKAAPEIRDALSRLKGITRTAGKKVADSSDELSKLPPEEQSKRLIEIVEKYNKAKGRKGETGAALNELLLAAGIGVPGAFVGAAMTPDDPLTGALLGASAGGAVFAPAAIRALIKHINESPNLSLATKQSSMQKVADKIKDTVSTFSWQMLPDAYRASLLTGFPNLPINAVVGPYGSALMFSIESALSGDPRGLRALKLLTPKRFLKEYHESLGEAAQRIRDAHERTEGVMGQAGPLWFRKGVAIPATALTAGDIASRRILMEAGFTEALGRTVTFTSEPVSSIGRATSHWRKTLTPEGKPYMLLNMLLPFFRTNLNQMEQGMARLPFVGPALQKAWKLEPVAKRQLVVQQLMSAGTMFTAFQMGQNAPEDPKGDRILLKFINNFGGQYGTTMALGYMAGRAVRDGKNPVTTALTQFIRRDMALPNADVLFDLVRIVGKVSEGKELGLKDLPTGLPFPPLAKDLGFISDEPRNAKRGARPMTPGDRAIKARKDRLKRAKAASNR